METLQTFLRERGIPEDIIAQVEEEKIDTTILATVHPDELTWLFPKFGDRVAIQNFCKNTQNSVKRKKGLVQRLRERIESSTKKKTTEKSSTLVSSDEEDQVYTNNKKLKLTRQIEIGWFCDDRQIRTRNGGGTRKVDIVKTAKKDDILKIAKNLFFPDNVSPKGPLEKFLVDIKDFNLKTIEDKYTIEQFFKLTKLARLRFYLTTNKIINTASRTQILPSSTSFLRNVRNPRIIYDEQDEIEITQELVPNATITSGAYETEVEENVADLHSVSIITDNNVVFSHHSSFDDHINSTHEMSTPALYYEDVITEIFDNLDQQVVTPTNEEDFYNIILHRGQVLKELIDAFVKVKTCTINVNIEMYEPNGKKEAGLDTGGVFRDALSEFWESFYDSCTNGTTLKVPIIREDYNEEKWQAIAKIIAVGWKHVKYFPIKISPVFMESCIFTDFKSNINDDFFKILSEPDRNIFKGALENFDQVEFNELIDVCSSLDCKRLPTKENLKQIVHDLAHKEIIQQPKYIIDCWQPFLKSFIEYETLIEVYQKREATQKNVLNMLSCIQESLTNNESQVYIFLKKFVRESDKLQLERFLRFCTGADIITENNIFVQFNSNTETYRMPTARTCSCVLELPTTYENFADFRTEMNSVLATNYWVMDFV